MSYLSGSVCAVVFVPTCLVLALTLRHHYSQTSSTGVAKRIHKGLRKDYGGEPRTTSLAWEKSAGTQNGLESNAGVRSLLEDLHHLSELYSESAVAKIWGIAARDLNRSNPPTLYPEYTKPGGVKYVYRELDFWTSGFFPGSLHVLLERHRKFSHISSGDRNAPLHPLQLEFACKWWTENLHQNAQLKGTHDLGFMIAPWAQKQWELNHDTRSFATMIETAKTLTARYNPKVGCIRSWDTCQTQVYSFNDLDSDFLVIIDNMMNLNLIFYVAAQTDDTEMFDIAVSHAKVSQREHIRPDFTTTHVINFDQTTGGVKQRLTNQGLAHESCWARGQAWAIAGFAETYGWTGDVSFLQTARGCADYFIANLPKNQIPPWDFDAPREQPQPTDTSAAMIAAYGMLLIHQAVRALGQPSEYLAAALKIADAVCARHLNPPANFVAQSQHVETVEHGVSDEIGFVTVDLGEGETILNGATINNFEFAPRRWANHGLVYADYFFLLFGNKLLEMGIGELVVKAKPA